MDCNAAPAALQRLLLLHAARRKTKQHGMHAAYNTVQMQLSVVDLSTPCTFRVLLPCTEGASKSSTATAVANSSDAGRAARFTSKAH
jgi:hypothetical protein